jgi:hypothetical protein
MKRPLKHLLDYLILCFLMSVSVVLTLLFNGNRHFQIITIVNTSFFYFLWGVLHHRKEKTLEPKIITEYLVMAILGTVLVISLL